MQLRIRREPADYPGRRTSPTMCGRFFCYGHGPSAVIQWGARTKGALVGTVGPVFGTTIDVPVAARMGSNPPLAGSPTPVPLGNARYLGGGTVDRAGRVGPIRREGTLQCGLHQESRSLASAAPGRVGLANSPTADGEDYELFRNTTRGAGGSRCNWASRSGISSGASGTASFG
jgi:hypothetical protein